MTRLTISEIAARHLDQWRDQTERGELQLWELPPAIQAWYFAGWAEAMQQAREQARIYEHRLNLLYMQAFSPNDRRAEYQRRLDHHFAEQAERFFTEPLIEGPALRRAA